MKTFLILFSVLFTAKTSAQNVILDTLYSNDRMNVALFFPSPIQQAITGSEDFIFTYNREIKQHFGLLQGVPGKESNLLVISESGSVFSYIVKYKEQLEQLNYFVADSSKIGEAIPEKDGDSKIFDKDTMSLSANKPTETQNIHMRLYSEYLLQKVEGIGNIKERYEGVSLKLENLVFEKDHLYFVMRLENNSSIDYELDFLELSTQIKQKGKRKSMQKLVQRPIIKYNLPHKVQKGHTARFVYVLPKFSLADDKVVILDLQEKNGERDLELAVKQRYINNPN